MGAGPRGVGEGRLRAVRARGFNRWVLGIASGIGLLTPIVWSLFGQWPAYRDGWRVVRGALPLADYQERFGQPYQGDYSYLADVWAAEYVRAATRPADGIFIWGFEPLVYVLSGRRPPTRFHFAVPLVSPWAPAGWRQELLRDLAARPPALFMVLRDDAIPWASGRADDSEQQLARFAGLRRFLQRHYRFERQIEHFAIYRRSSYR